MCYVYCVVVWYLCDVVDQLNSAIHVTMLNIPYELVFSQPTRHNMFPGMDSVRVLEGDVDNIVEDEQENGRDLNEEDAEEEEHETV